MKTTTGNPESLQRTPSCGQRLVRLLYPYGAERTILRGPARGMRFVVEPGIGLSYAVAPRTTNAHFFLSKIRKGMTVFDVGANKGQMAILFAALVGKTGRVVSFEPVSREFQSLRRNIQINGLKQVQPIEAAASDREGNVEFAYAEDRPSQGKLQDAEPTYQVAGAHLLFVRSVTLDSILKEEPPPDLIKIDVEGGAAAVLRGAGTLLDKFAPSIYLELHGPEEQCAVRDELMARGYLAETLAGRLVHDPVAESPHVLWCYRPN